MQSFSDVDESIAALLNEFGQDYSLDRIVDIPSDGREIFIVSDLHMSDGQSSSGTYNGTENFFADESFERFLEHVHANRKKPLLLVMNGDVIDFLRVLAVPETDADFLAWESVLRSIGITDKTQDILRASVSEKEMKFGLKTHAYKSVWKLDRVMRGHPAFFMALARWLSRGHAVVILKGNHDLEWYWPEVRKYLRLALATRMQEPSGGVSLSECLTRINSLLRFVDDACVVDGEIYVEHGHRYDKFAEVVGGKVWGKSGEELNIPFGSFINRYLINRIELLYPFLDNVRPTQNILHILMRERFFLGLKMLLYYVPFTIRMIPKSYVKFMLNPVFSYFLAVGVPLFVVIILWGGKIVELFAQTGTPPAAETGLLGTVAQYGADFLKDTLWLFLSYLFSRLVSYLQLTEPEFLLDPGTRKLQENPAYRLVTMGHTHNPEAVERDGRWYMNSSTWIPVVESSSAALRQDKTYALIHVARDDRGNFVIRPLQRWNDEAGRIETLVIVDRK